jgi:prepilin-type processing-associated H-X9-DG protein
MNTGNDLAFGTNPTQDSLVSNRRGIDDVMYLHPNRSANMLHADGHVEPKRFPLMGEYDRFGAESSPLGSWEQEDL